MFADPIGVKTRCMLLVIGSLLSISIVSGMSIQEKLEFDAQNRTLVLYNLNDQESLEIAQYYITQRNISDDRLCPVELPVGMFATGAQFLGARKSIIEHCICAVINQTLPLGSRPDPCNLSNQDGVANTSPITHLVIIRGIPARMIFTGWSIPTSGPYVETTAGPSLDYYLSAMLYGNNELMYDTVEEMKTGFVEESAYVSATETDSIAGYLGPINVSKHRILGYGRIEATTKDRTLQLIDRTLAAEQTGFTGNFLSELRDPPDTDPTYSFFRDLSSSRHQECRDYLDVPEEWPYTECRTGATANGGIPGEATTTTMPRAINAGIFIGDEYSGNGQAGFDGFSTLLNWHKTEYDCTELCEDFPDPGDEVACRANSTDVFREINTDCVGVANGFMGWQYRSFPVQYMGFWPTGWTHTYSGATIKTPPEVLTGGAYTGANFTDDKYLHFGYRNATLSPTCTFENGSTTDCSEYVGINLRKTQTLSPAVTITGSRNYTVRFRYRNNASAGSKIYVRSQVRYSGNDFDNTTASASFLLTTEHTDWTLFEWNFSNTKDGLSYTLINIDLYNLRTEFPRGSVDFDGFELIDLETNESLWDLNESSFNSPFIGETNPGDYASHAIERLGAIAWWGSSSHHLTGGHAFRDPYKFVGAFFSGRTLGEGLAYLGHLKMSGIAYADPLYRPSAIKIYIADGSSEINSQDSPYVFTQVHAVKDEPLRINALHGQGNLLTTFWNLSSCYQNITVCDTGGTWTPLASGIGAVFEENTNITLFNLVKNISENSTITIRLQVMNPGDEANNLTNYAFLDYVYVPDSCQDQDVDGYFVGDGCGELDCNDEDGSVNPGASEVCRNGIDDDCDGFIDESVCPDYGNITAWLSRYDYGIREPLNLSPFSKIYNTGSYAFEGRISIDLRKGTSVPIINSSMILANPEISEDKIVGLQSGTGYQLMLYDIAGDNFTLLENFSVGTTSYTISGDWIAWTSNVQGNWSLYLYSISSGNKTSLTPPTVNATTPNMDGNQIVWVDDRGDKKNSLIYYDLENGSAIQLINSTSYQIYPRISNKSIVYVDINDSVSYVYIDIASNKTIVFENNTYSYYALPDISGDTIVFSRLILGRYYKVMTFDVNTLQETQLTTSYKNEVFPRISGDSVVFGEGLSAFSTSPVRISLATGMRYGLANSTIRGFTPRISGDRMIGYGVDGVLLENISSFRKQVVLEEDPIPISAGEDRSLELFNEKGVRVNKAGVYEVHISYIDEDNKTLDMRFGPLESIIQFRVQEVCGNGFCEMNETLASCATDCNFSFRMNQSLFNGSTNFSQYNATELRNLPNVTLNRPRGRIRFLRNLELRRSLNLTPDNIQIESGRIFVNSSALEEFNVSAELEFFNLTYISPTIRRNSVTCPGTICSNENYNRTAGTFSVHVTGFSEYAIVEGPYCGDGSCNNGETSSSCAGDCPASSSTSGSSGGGGWYCRNETICGDWEECTEGQRSRSCWDKNNCTDFITVQNETCVEQEKPDLIEQDSKEGGTAEDDESTGSAPIMNSLSQKPEISEKGFPWIFTIICLVIIVGGTTAFLMVKLKKPSIPILSKIRTDAPPGTRIPREDNLQRLVTYISTNTNFPHELIKAKLLAAHWDEQLVDTAIHVIEESQVNHK